MTERARLTIITLLLLRLWLSKRCIQPLYLKAVESTICPSSQLNAFDSITQCFAHMAGSNTLILSEIAKTHKAGFTEGVLKHPHELPPGTAMVTERYVFLGANEIEISLKSSKTGTCTTR